MISIKTVAILCGGKSQRLGRDKAFLEVDSQYMIEYIIMRVKKYFKNIFLITKTADLKVKLQELFKNINIITDTVQNKHGPIFGLLTALESIKEEDIFILSCDTPLINLQVIDLIYQCLGEHYAVIPRWPNGYIEPLYALYKRIPVLNELKEFINSGEKKLGLLISKLPKVLY
ncbi:MAG: molybdenum cofactor guanylyltransferase [Candidatus Odinarchaeia archaeon]